MATLNIEIKARCANPAAVREYLRQLHAREAGTDHQTDTYFNVTNGRLKLREGNIENNLIFYTRENQEGPKQSSFRLVKVPDAGGLKATLELSCGVKAVVRKKREIFYVENVKFHIDEVESLGSFMEIEAFNEDGMIASSDLEKQCGQHMRAIGIQADDLIDRSYSDMILEQNLQQY